jgi:hypothetical protein
MGFVGPNCEGGAYIEAGRIRARRRIRRTAGKPYMLSVELGKIPKSAFSPFRSYGH